MASLTDPVALGHREAPSRVVFGPHETNLGDGRALSESIFMDYSRILYNHDANDGKSAQELLDGYAIEAMVLNSFE